MTTGDDDARRTAPPVVWHDAADPDSLRRAVDEPVRLSAHDASWTASFAAERDRLMRALPGAFIDIRHIGSTAVDDIVSKPIVDLLAGVASMDAAVALDGPLGANGYATSVDFNRLLTDRRFFLRHAAGRRTHHLHVVVFGSQRWHDHLAFCDVLRADSDLRQRYERLKMDLVLRYANDRDAYTDGKSLFIQSTLQGRGDR